MIPNIAVSIAVYILCGPFETA